MGTLLGEKITQLAWFAVGSEENEGEGEVEVETR